MCIPREKRTMSHTVTRREKKSNNPPHQHQATQRSVGNQLERANEQATTAAVAAKVNVRMRRKKSAEAAAEKRETERDRKPPLHTLMMES